jgi:hypothetical protein
MEKQFKLLRTLTFNSELKFEQKNSRWKGIEEGKTYTNHNFELGTKIFKR